MGYVTREIEGGSTALSSTYPACYRETQIHNWTPVDIVITYRNGRQEFLPRWPKTATKSQVEITTRSVTGMRTKTEKNKIVDVPIPAKKITIDYQDFVLYPVKVEELDILISTKDHSLLAKNIINESGYSPECNESFSDYETTDPRFIFEVKDPFNRWDCLYVNVFGQTITLRCGHENQLIADLDEATVASMSSECKLSCYLRYPSNYMQMDETVVSVFTLNLSNLDREEPYILPSGEVICIASSTDALQRVIAKKHSGVPEVKIEGMISKEVHERAVEQLRAQLEAEKQNSEQALRQVKTAHAAALADMKFKLDDSKRKIDIQAKELEYWNSLHESSVERYAREDKLSSAREKMREEAAENSRKDTESVYTALKIGGTIAAGVLSFAITLLLKTASKK